MEMGWRCQSSWDV